MHQIPKEEVCVCFIKITYLLLDVMIFAFYLNVLLVRLNWKKNLYFLLGTIDLRVKLQWNLRAIIKVSLKIIKYR